MKPKFLISTAAVFTLLLALILWAPMRDAAASRGEVAFSHDTHKDVECSKCHPASESTVATDNLLPKPEVCTDCHSPEDVRSYWSLEAGADLTRQPIAPKGMAMLFSHKGHLGMKGMDCVKCHGVMTEAGPHHPSMEACATCHNNAEGGHTAGEGPMISATNRCEACHVSLAGLMPANHRSVSFRRMHGRQAQNGGMEENCAVCHSESFCDECHTPTNDVPVDQTKSRFYTDIWPRSEKQDDGRLTTVQAVHSLTWRYTHGFEARAQSSRCTQCHDHETFCTPCHETGYDANGVRAIPQSHLLAGFKSISGGSAQNRHAKLAKMDLESCAVCHNVEGGDPVCAVCHSTGIVKEKGD